MKPLCSPVSGNTMKKIINEDIEDYSSSDVFLALPDTEDEDLLLLYVDGTDVDLDYNPS